MSVPETESKAFLRGLVRTKSLSGEEEAVVEVASSYLVSQGVTQTRVGNNLIARSGTQGPSLLLVSHLDTVPPCEGWEKDPWDAQWRDGKLVGLGSNDAKGCAATMVEAFLTHFREDLPGQVVLVLAAEEEIGGAAGISLVLPTLGTIDGAIVGEPTGLEVCLAQRGMLILKGIAKGVSGHVAHPDVTQNAIHKAGNDIVRIENKQFPCDPLLGAVSGQVTLIQGGLKRNQVPDHCEFFVDFRTTPSAPAEAITQWAQAEWESEVEVFSNRYLCKSLKEGHPLASLALSASQRDRGIGSATVSDWCFLGDIPAVKLGPGETKRSHTANEYLTETEFEDGCLVYQAIIRSFAEALRDV
ncbi:MAG: M20/M25/M40 family metallo-hydrolase [Fimbriimonadaceae bacterium]|jgi:acetylornithine deacetylase|nr:M20/M25/M40 family metallo-hydrolase [Fimbriimonadaceae bacterium]